MPQGRCRLFLVTFKRGVAQWRNPTSMVLNGAPPRCNPSLSPEHPCLREIWGPVWPSCPSCLTAGTGLCPKHRAASGPCSLAKISSQSLSALARVPVVTECPHTWDPGEHLAHSCEERGRSLDLLLESSIILVCCLPPLTSM